MEFNSRMKSHIAHDPPDYYIDLTNPNHKKKHRLPEIKKKSNLSYDFGLPAKPLNPRRRIEDVFGASLDPQRYDLDYSMSPSPNKMKSNRSDDKNRLLHDRLDNSVQYSYGKEDRGELRATSLNRGSKQKKQSYARFLENQIQEKEIKRSIDKKKELETDKEMLKSGEFYRYFDKSHPYYKSKNHTPVYQNRKTIDIRIRRPIKQNGDTEMFTIPSQDNFANTDFHTLNTEKDHLTRGINPNKYHTLESSPQRLTHFDLEYAHNVDLKIEKVLRKIEHELAYEHKKLETEIERKHQEEVRLLAEKIEELEQNQSKLKNKIIRKGLISEEPSTRQSSAHDHAFKKADKFNSANTTARRLLRKCDREPEKPITCDADPQAPRTTDSNRSKVNNFELNKNQFHAEIESIRNELHQNTDKIQEMLGKFKSELESEREMARQREEELKKNNVIGLDPKKRGLDHESLLSLPEYPTYDTYVNLRPHYSTLHQKPDPPPEEDLRFDPQNLDIGGVKEDPPQEKHIYLHVQPSPRDKNGALKIKDSQTLAPKSDPPLDVLVNQNDASNIDLNENGKTEHHIFVHVETKPVQTQEDQPILIYSSQPNSPRTQSTGSKQRSNTVERTPKNKPIKTDSSIVQDRTVKKKNYGVIDRLNSKERGNEIIKKARPNKKLIIDPERFETYETKEQMSESDPPSPKISGLKPVSEKSKFDTSVSGQDFKEKIKSAAKYSTFKALPVETQTDYMQLADLRYQQFHLHYAPSPTGNRKLSFGTQTDLTYNQLPNHTTPTDNNIPHPGKLAETGQQIEIQGSHVSENSPLERLQMGTVQGRPPVGKNPMEDSLGPLLSSKNTQFDGSKESHPIASFGYIPESSSKGSQFYVDKKPIPPPNNGVMEIKTNYGFIQSSPKEPLDPKKRIKSLGIKFKQHGMKRKRLEYNINIARSARSRQKN